MKALPKIVLALTAVAVLSVVYPASVQADTTYTYTGNPFTSVSGPPHTMSDFVSGMLTLAGPLAPNFNGFVTPIAFSFSDGVQTITNLTPGLGQSLTFHFQTGPIGVISDWNVDVFLFGGVEEISTVKEVSQTIDFGVTAGGAFGQITNHAGVWATVAGVPDTGSTLSLMTLTPLWRWV
jgi:hypothetical protein